MELPVSCVNDKINNPALPEYDRIIMIEYTIHFYPNSGTRLLLNKFGYVTCEKCGKNYFMYATKLKFVINLITVNILADISRSFARNLTATKIVLHQFAISTKNATGYS